jgi:RNA polymerase sigma-70 factor, ECF subfamily
VTAIGTTSAVQDFLINAWSALTVPAAIERDDASISDERLMLDYRSGSASAFQKLYRRHCDRLHRFILRIAAGAADADEIFQEVWIAVIRGREHYEPSARFSTYLYAIAHRRAADRMRTQWRAGEEIELDEDDDALIEASALDPPEIVWRTGAGEALLAAIAALPLPQREAFLLQAESELTLEEIAEATATNRETVKSRLRYANRRLRDALKAWR